MERLRIGIVGAGPAGAYAAWRAARIGHEVTFFDHRAPWEKPCGGGVTVKAQDDFPWIGDIATLARGVIEFRFLSPKDRPLEFTCPRETLIFARETFDEEIRRRAEADGARRVKRKVQHVERENGGWRLEASQGTGLANLCARLRALYGNAASLTAGSGPAGGFAVTARLPFQPAVARAWR